MKDWNKTPYAIAVDEKTAVCIDESGIAEVLGDNKAYFIKTDANKKPETITLGTPITWNHEGKALSVHALTKGNNVKYNLTNFIPENTNQTEKLWWSIHSGVWSSINQ